MICCVGLIVGSALGSSMGGPWVVIGPATGFGLGLLADIKLMGGRSKDARSDEGHRGGCCIGGYLSGEGATPQHKDPVCGMIIEEKSERYKTTFKEHMYYFCSPECESSFKGNPEKYK